jgi:hypothetical protein
MATWSMSSARMLRRPAMLPRNPAPALRHIAHLSVEVGPPVEVGATMVGRRRVVPILGGTVEGTLLRGRVLPGGADYQVIRTATVTEVHARYVLETVTGERVYVENTGYRTGSADDIERLNRGLAVDPKRIYFRSVPRFETESARLAHLNHSVFVGTGERHPDRVEFDFYLVT